MRPFARLAVVLAVVLVPGGCAVLSSDRPQASSSSGSRPGTPSGTASGTQGDGTASGSPSPTPGGELPGDLRTRPAVAAAIDDVARRQGVAPDQVVVAAWSPVTWNDGSLGCPRKGMTYTQALVPGELLILRVDGQLFQYHAATGRPFAYCATPSADYSVDD